MNPPTMLDGGGGSTGGSFGIKGALAAAAAAHANPNWSPLYDAIGANAGYLQSLYSSLGSGDPSMNTASAGSYYKYLPELSRGQAETGNQWPRNDFLNGTDCFPRILAVGDGPWSGNTTAWDAPYDWVANTGQGKLFRYHMSFNQFKAQPGTVQFDDNTWYNLTLAAYFTFSPQLLFTKLVQQQRLWADPLAGYWRNYNNAYSEPTYAVSVARFVVAVVAAVFGGEALAGVDGTAAGTAAEATAASGSTVEASTVVADTTAVDESSAALTTIDTSITGNLITASTLVAPTGIGLTDLATGASALSQGGGLLDTASGLVNGAAKVIGTLTGIKALVDAGSTPPGAPAGSTAPPAKKFGAAAVIAGLIGLIAVEVLT